MREMPEEHDDVRQRQTEQEEGPGEPKLAGAQLALHGHRHFARAIERVAQLPHGLIALGRRKQLAKLLGRVQRERSTNRCCLRAGFARTPLERDHRHVAQRRQRLLLRGRSGRAGVGRQ